MTTWTDERVEVLKQLAAQVDPPLSASDIARRMGDCSRNAVIGKVHRLGLKLYTSSFERRTFNALPRRPVPRKRVSAVTFTRQVPPQPAQTPLPIPRADDKARVSFAELEDHHCRFIPGEPRDGYCGLPKVEGTSYCPGHLARCTTEWEGRSAFTHARIGGTQTTAANVAEVLEPA